ncbi:hypothetical protein NL676_029537 [Syzygium grande]|nr:hypothetical protein NL676_029537 [Syzygium grande]
MLQDNLVGPWRGNGGTSWDDGTYHGLREITTFPSLYFPHEHIFEDRKNGSEEKNKKKKKKQPWQGYGGTSWDDWTYHGVREITLEENGSEEIEVGPWGGNGGTSWDDGTFHGVTEITLVFGHCINSICVVYDKNGMPVAAEKHGGAGGNQTAEIKLQSPDEYLVSVSGYYSPMARGGSPVVRSLTFKSNTRTFGPFGMKHGTPFSSPVDGGRIVGFMGRSGHHLDAIGFRVSRAKPSNVVQRTICLPKWRDSHIQGTNLAAPRCYRDPYVLTDKSTPSPAPLQNF